MENTLLQTLNQKVREWSDKGYKGAYKETLNILNHIKRVGYLHKPQIEALETYIYLKEITNNEPLYKTVNHIYKDDPQKLLLSLGLSQQEALTIAFDRQRDEKINEKLREKYNGLDYPNQVYALTMGAGKTILMGVMMIYDFVLSFYHPEDKRFGKNALIFAPDTTIIDSLKEIKTFDYTRVLPKEYQSFILNVKYYYLETPETPLNPIGNYNIIVSNSQKIILKTRHKEDLQAKLFRDMSLLKSKAIENKRLQAIRELNDLIVFVDEAHHSFGTTLEGTLKKTKETINYIHTEGKTPVVAVINLTGTPYVNNKMISDVVYHFGLKQGVEKGILKQIRFFEYGNVRTEGFIEDVIDKFWNEYGENRLEGKLPKIAFYSANIEDLQSELRPLIEKILIQKNISTEKVLEYHTKAEASKEEFRVLDTDDSKKQFILLVGKGTEGWNCRSLVSCALYRKPQSSIFVLQSSTRCLRSIADNSTIASIFLSQDNAKILDKELKNNFSTSIEELKNQEQKDIEHTLTVEKKKKLMVKKLIKEIISRQIKKPNEIKINWNEFNAEKYEAYISQRDIVLTEGQEAKYITKLQKEKVKIASTYTFYEIVELINRYTHLPCLFISEVLKANGQDIVGKVSNNNGVLVFLIEQIIRASFQYDEKTETVEEELELTKRYPFKISVNQSKNSLVVYKQQEDKNNLGFHINPYNFDSLDEKSLFSYLREVLDKDEAIVDIYFTGGVTDQVHNDFFFEYYSPQNKRIAKYFPDFLIETTKGRFLVVEVKANSEKLSYEQNKKTYQGKKDDLFDEVFAKELGFMDFKKLNGAFDYHIIFDAGLQQQQTLLYKSIESCITEKP
ncbi:MAG: DEAD/DEAH box helicase family protein [Exilispira sp.]|nr:DEAD/DEAH box helicase family protein [Exilispira sp.]